MIRFAEPPNKMTTTRFAMKNALFSTSSSEWQPEKFKFVEDVVHSKPLSCPRAWFSKLLELNITKRFRAMKAKV